MGTTHISSEISTSVLFHLERAAWMYQIDRTSIFSQWANFFLNSLEMSHFPKSFLLSVVLDRQQNVFRVKSRLFKARLPLEHGWWNRGRAPARRCLAGLRLPWTRDSPSPQKAPFRLFPTILCLWGARAEENQFWLAGLMLFKIFKAGLYKTVQKSLLDFYLPLVCHSVLVLRLGKQIRSYVFVLKTVDI